jgi:hypothetical protein
MGRTLGTKFCSGLSREVIPTIKISNPPTNTEIIRRGINSPLISIMKISNITVSGTNANLKLKEDLCDINTIKQAKSKFPRGSSVPCKGTVLKTFL